MSVNFLVGLLPALFWGFTPVFVNKIGGKPYHQHLGTAFGCGIVALLVLIIFRPEWIPSVAIGAIISGLAWSVGQLCQYRAYVILGTSKAFALSISIEMLLNSLVGALIFREWTTTHQLIQGFGAIACVIIGGNLTAYSDHKEKGELAKGLLTLSIGACGFCVWNYALKVVNADGITAIVPQAIGMVVGSIILNAITSPNEKKYNKTTLLQILPGLIYAMSNISLIFSNSLNGVAVGYTMAQLCLVIELILGFLFLHEANGKSKKEIAFSVIGAVFITVGCILVGLV